MNDKITDHFTRDELACRCGCGMLNPAPDFHKHLEKLRVEFGAPMPINSACRCNQHNINVGGAKRSYHIGDASFRSFGYCAVDVRLPAEHPDRERFITLAHKRGWSIGLHRRFVHIDLRSEYDGVKPVVFAY